jgi:hypothetical protein
MATPVEPYDELVSRVQQLAAKKSLTGSAQEMVGLISNILARKAVKDNIAEFQLQLSIALGALEAEVPNIRVARDVIYDVDARTIVLGSFIERSLLGKASGSPIAVVNVAMPVSFALFGMGNALFYYSVAGSPWFGSVFATRSYFLATCCAFLASIISLMQRASIPSDLKACDLVTLFYTSIWKPMTAAVIAGVMYLGFEAGLIIGPHLVDPDKQKVLFYGVMGFLVGFSERFAADILTRTQATIASNVAS